MFKAFVIAMLFVACATGGTADQPKQDASVHFDSQNVLPKDAPIAGDAHLIDAFVFHDAPPPPPDAPVQGGGICTDNTNCQAAGECCFVAICVPGQAIGTNLCIPN